MLFDLVGLMHRWFALVICVGVCLLVCGVYLCLLLLFLVIWVDCGVLLFECDLTVYIVVCCF